MKNTTYSSIFTKTNLTLMTCALYELEEIPQFKNFHATKT